jgi:esterase/lipase superfamily enzyme
MPTTVFFATNRVLTGDPALSASYSNGLQPPSDGTGIIYGSAFVDGIDVASNTQGTISSIQETQVGRFPDQAAADLGDGGRNILVFIHGFDNSFNDAITRAAFNREFLAASGAPGTDATVVAFSWPSLGQIVSFPILQADYLTDQNTARASGYHLMTFLANLQPILKTARDNGRRTMLLAHSMGNLALQSAVENWFLHGNGPASMFNAAALCAGDCGYDAFGQPPPASLSNLPQLAGTISIYYSHVDNVLQLSFVVNDGAARLGQDGPRNRTDPAKFPPSAYTMVDATDFRDYDFNFLTSHQYYRSSATCRKLLAGALGG